MRSVVASFLACLMLLGSLIPQNDLAELSKLPTLIEHYQFHHSAAGGRLSLIEFLAEHYGAGLRHEAGCYLSQGHQRDHHNLPLHNHANCPEVLFVLTSARPVLPAAAPAWATGRTYQLPMAANCPDGPATALLQPPRA